MNQYLIAANSKKAQLIFNAFRPVDLIILGIGVGVSFILFLAIQPETLALAALVLGPGLVCTFLVLPVANYHNILCILQNIYNFYFVDKNNLRWKGWCASDEYK